MRKIIMILALLLALFIPAAFAQTGHVTLLAVMDNNGNISGSAADLYLEIKPGSGRVFLETFPLTKLDTQISTRFAKDVACKYAEINCDDYDFFYTIKAESPIVGGPSAGAAISTLTVALLTNSDFDESTAISGTINSGGIIGPVGGLKEKLDAARERGIKRVLIPKGESITSLENSSLNLSDYGSSFGIEVLEVSELDEAVRYFTGKSFEADSYEPEVDEEYSAVMKLLAEQLCNKSTSFNDAFRFSTPSFGKRFLAAEEEALDLMDNGIDSLRAAHYYSAASYCFGANVRYRYLSLLAQDLGKKNISEKINGVRSQIADFRSSIPKYETITDLQAYGAVIERVEDATLQINISDNYLKAGNEDRAIFALAYATERLDSAYAWSSFFGKKGRKFDLSNEALKESCSRKLAEAEERTQYAQLFYPGFLNSTNNVLDKAYEEQKANNYELCLFKATRAKAEANTVLDIISVDDRIGDVIDKQLKIIRKNIISQTEEGIFPIVSYSYYEYARSLKETEPYSSILYAELASELSGLDLYFKAPANGKPKQVIIEADEKSLMVFVIGMLLGGLLIFALTKRKKRRVIITKRRKNK